MRNETYANKKKTNFETDCTSSCQNLNSISIQLFEFSKLNYKHNSLGYIVTYLLSLGNLRFCFGIFIQFENERKKSLHYLFFSNNRVNLTTTNVLLSYCFVEKKCHY